MFEILSVIGYADSSPYSSLNSYSTRLRLVSLTLLRVPEYGLDHSGWRRLGAFGPASVVVACGSSSDFLIRSRGVRYKRASSLLSDSNLPVVSLRSLCSRLYQSTASRTPSASTSKSRGLLRTQETFGRSPSSAALL